MKVAIGHRPVLVRVALHCGGYRTKEAQGMPSLGFTCAAGTHYRLGKLVLMVMAGWSLLGLALVAQANDAAVYQWKRRLEMAPVTESTPLAVRLDDTFYQATRDGWPDVRVVNQQGQPAPFLIRPVTTEKTVSTRKFWTARQTAAQVDAATGLQIDLITDDKQPIPQGLKIITPLKNFEQQVRVESSPDGETWTSLGPPSLIFDYSQYVDARNDMVLLKGNTQRRLRCIVQNITAEQESQLMELQRGLQGWKETQRTERLLVARIPFRVDRIDFLQDETRTVADTTVTHSETVTAIQVEERAKEKQTVVTFESPRSPVTSIGLVASSLNFSRAVRVETELPDHNGQKHWQSLATGLLTHLQVGPLQQKELRISIPETRSPRYRLVIENRDSPPLTIDGIEMEGPDYELNILATAGDVYDLEYGSATAPFMQYDTVALESIVQQRIVRQPATLGPAVENTAAGVQVPQWKPWNDSRVLVGAIVLLTVGLGWALYRTSRRLDATPPIS